METKQTIVIFGATGNIGCLQIYLSFKLKKLKNLIA